MSDDVDRIPKEEYRERWVAHLAEFQRLEQHLTDEQRDVLMDAREQIERLIDVAAENRESDR